MIKAIICKNGQVTVKEIENSFNSILQYVGPEAVEFYPFSDKEIAAVMSPETDEFSEIWSLTEGEIFFGPAIFIHADPFNPEYESLTNEDLEFLQRTIKARPGL